MTTRRQDLTAHLTPVPPVPPSIRSERVQNLAAVLPRDSGLHRRNGPPREAGRAFVGFDPFPPAPPFLILLDLLDCRLCISLGRWLVLLLRGTVLREIRRAQVKMTCGSLRTLRSSFPPLAACMPHAARLWHDRYAQCCPFEETTNPPAAERGAVHSLTSYAVAPNKGYDPKARSERGNSTEPEDRRSEKRNSVNRDRPSRTHPVLPPQLLHHLSLLQVHGADTSGYNSRRDVPSMTRASEIPVYRTAFRGRGRRRRGERACRRPRRSSACLRGQPWRPCRATRPRPGRAWQRRSRASGPVRRRRAAHRRA